MSYGDLDTMTTRPGRRDEVAAQLTGEFTSQQGTVLGGLGVTP